jgi:hypothetical protein
MTDKYGWVTVQMRVRSDTHDYLTREAQESGISITQAAGVLLEHCRRENLKLGPVTVVRHPAEVIPPAGPTSRPAGGRTSRRA